MEFSSLLSGSDNLFKYLFTAGVVLIVASLVYPLQKKQDIEIEICSHNKEVELLNSKISLMRSQTKSIEKSSNRIIDSLTSLQKLKNTHGNKAYYDQLINQIKSDYNNQFDIMQKRQQEIEVSSIVLDHDRRKIELLKNHSNTYSDYFNWFLWIGIICSLVGLFFWSLSTFKKEKLVSIELKDKESKLVKKD